MKAQGLEGEVARAMASGKENPTHISCIRANMGAAIFLQHAATRWQGHSASKILWHRGGRRRNKIHTRSSSHRNVFFLGIDMEAEEGIEPSNDGFANHCLTTWLLRYLLMMTNSL